MTDSKEKFEVQQDVSYQIENRQFVIHRQFGTEQTLTELVASEISHGFLQSKPLIGPSEYGIMGL